MYLSNARYAGILRHLRYFSILFISVIRHTARILNQHALKGQKQVFAPYALKGQQLLAQGSALGNHRRAPIAL